MFKKIALAVTIPVIVVAAAAAISVQTHATQNVTCTNDAIKRELAVAWSSSKDQITLSTGDKGLCKDVDLYFSAYAMPDTWNKKGFNDTAIPQTLHRSVNIKLKAGEQIINQTVYAQMPSDCKNVQIDLYFGPEQKSITQTERIGARLISAQHKSGIGKCAVVTPQAPTTPTPDVKPTPVVENVKVTPAEVETSIPVELPKTGSTVISSLVVILVGVSVYAATFRLRR